MSVASTDPKGFDRSKALPIEKAGSETSPVWKVYNVNGVLLGAFSDESKAIEFRDTVPLEKALLTGRATGN